MTKTYYFKTTNNNDVSIDIPEPGQINSCYIFGIHKSGSTLLNKLLKDVFNETNIPFVAPEEQLFLQGYTPSHVRDDLSKIFFDKGYFYLGFRNFWIGSLNVDLSGKKCILLVRDPRDSIVSHFFSSKYSHVLPKTGIVKEKMEELRSEINLEKVSEYVLRENILNLFTRNHEQYYKGLPHKTTRVYRYEDVIFFKKEWLANMLEFLDIELPTENIIKIAEKHDIIPGNEQPKRFVRQVIPGNYKKHLSKFIIDELNKRFKPILMRYGYNKVHFNQLR